MSEAVGAFEAESSRLHNRIRALLIFFIVGLALSGITAFPLVWEVGILNRLFGTGSGVTQWWPALSQWISLIHHGLVETEAKFPFILYGTDWLAFAHIIIAIAFWGPLRDPVRNVWVIEFGMIACLLVIPTALICGQVRGIPVFWRLIDCSFGVFGILPLWFVRRDVHKLVALSPAGPLTRLASETVASLIETGERPGGNDFRGGRAEQGKEGG